MYIWNYNIANLYAKSVLIYAITNKIWEGQFPHTLTGTMLSIKIVEMHFDNLVHTKCTIITALIWIKIFF